MAKVKAKGGERERRASCERPPGNRQGVSRGLERPLRGHGDFTCAVTSEAPTPLPIRPALTRVKSSAPVSLFVYTGRPSSPATPLIDRNGYTQHLRKYPSGPVHAPPTFFRTLIFLIVSHGNGVPSLASIVIPALQYFPFPLFI